MSRVQAKVVMLGEGRVGKTSLVLRFCKDTFSDSQPPTIQASFLDKPMTVGDKRVNLAIWDTAGQERFHALGPIYYRAADAALLVYDISDPDSFIKVQTWVKELRKMVSRRCRAAAAVSAAPPWSGIKAQRHTPLRLPHGPTHPAPGRHVRWETRSCCRLLATSRTWTGIAWCRGRRRPTTRPLWARTMPRRRPKRAAASTTSLG